MRTIPVCSVGASVYFACIAFFLALLGPSSAKAYEGDHYAWTYYLALQVGYTPRQAYQIASGAYAIDFDKDTAPLPHGSLDEARTALNFPRPELAATWLKFHAFTDADAEAGDFERGERLREQRKAELWQMALKERNPGPYIHYAQDFYAHFGWDDRTVGHFAAGHLPDFLDYNHMRARQMTQDTLGVLVRFMREALGESPAAPDMGRVWEVLERLYEANRVPLKEEDIQNAFPQITLYGPGLTRVKALNLLDLVINSDLYTTLKDAAPDLRRSVSVIRQAAREDIEQGRLPRFPPVAEEDSFRPEALPLRWIPYNYDSEGRVVNDNNEYTVENPKLQFGEPAVEYTASASSGKVKVSIKLPYRIEGLSDSLNFMPDLPTLEVGEVSGGERKVWVETWSHGSDELQSVLWLPASALQGDGLTWRGQGQLYGHRPVSREIRLQYSAPEDPDPEQVVGGDIGPLLDQLEEHINLANALYADAEGACGRATARGEKIDGRLDNLARWRGEFEAELGARARALAELPGFADQVAGAAGSARSRLDALGPLRGSTRDRRDAVCRAPEALAAAEVPEEYDRLLAGAKSDTAAAGVDAGEANRVLEAIRADADEARNVAAQARQLVAPDQSLARALARQAQDLEQAATELGGVEGSRAAVGRARSAAVGSRGRVMELLVEVQAAVTPETPESQRERLGALAGRAGTLGERQQRVDACQVSLADALAGLRDRLASARSAIAGLQQRAGDASGSGPAGEALKRMAESERDVEATLATAELFADAARQFADTAQGCLEVAMRVPRPEPPGTQVAGDDTGDDDGGWSADPGTTVKAEPSEPAGMAYPDGLDAAARAAFLACDYPTALLETLELQSRYPNHPWVTGNLTRVRELAQRQEAAARLIVQARDLIARESYGEARETLNRAMNSAVSCQEREIADLMRQANDSLIAIERERERREREKRRRTADALTSILTTVINIANDRDGGGTTTGVVPPPVKRTGSDGKTSGSGTGSQGSGGADDGLLKSRQCYIQEYGGRGEVTLLFEHRFKGTDYEHRNYYVVSVDEDVVPVMQRQFGRGSRCSSIAGASCRQIYRSSSYSAVIRQARQLCPNPARASYP